MGDSPGHERDRDPGDQRLRVLDEPRRVAGTQCPYSAALDLPHALVEWVTITREGDRRCKLPPRALREADPDYVLWSGTGNTDVRVKRVASTAPDGQKPGSGAVSRAPRRSRASSASTRRGDSSSAGGTGSATRLTRSKLHCRALGESRGPGLVRIFVAAGVLRAVLIGNAPRGGPDPCVPARRQATHGPHPFPGLVTLPAPCRRGPALQCGLRGCYLIRCTYSAASGCPARAACRIMSSASRTRFCIPG